MKQIYLLLAISFISGCAGLQHEFDEAQYNRTELRSGYVYRARAELHCEDIVKQKTAHIGTWEQLMGNHETRVLVIGMKLDCMRGFGWL